MSVIILNDRFSLNVGDGLLSACLEHELRRELGGALVNTVDIDGKPGYPAVSEAEPADRGSLKRRLVRAIPTRFKAQLNAPRVMRRLRLAIDRHDSPKVFVIGGGHLINGHGDYFPLRINAISKIAKSLGAGLMVHGVGVTDPGTWRPESRNLLREAFDGNPALRFVSVRDELSLRHWRQAFGNTPEPLVLPDPGLLANELAGVLPNGSTERNTVGVGVIAEETAQALGARGRTTRSSSRFYLELCEALSRRGFRPLLFTNGEPADQRQAEDVHRQLQCRTGMKEAVDICERPVDERSLLHTVGSFDALVAHRMHANIAAYSLGIPPVGLAWDEKLESFFASVDLLDNFVPAGSASVGHIVSMLERAVRNGLDGRKHRQAVSGARLGISTLAEQIRGFGDIASWTEPARRTDLPDPNMVSRQ